MTDEWLDPESLGQAETPGYRTRHGIECPRCGRIYGGDWSFIDHWYQLHDGPIPDELDVSRERSEETKKKISETLTGRELTEEHRQKMSEGLEGHEIFTHTMGELDDLLETRQELGEHMKVAMTSDRDGSDDTVELFQNEVQTVEGNIGELEENVVKMCKAIRNSMNRESFDEDVHGDLRQFVFARFQQIQEEMQQKQMEALQQQAQTQQPQQPGPGPL